MKKKVAVITGITVLTLGIAVTGGIYAWNQYNQMEIKDAVLELGQTVSTEAQDYVTANEHVLSECSVNVSKVDNMTVGTYPVTVTHGKDTVIVKVTVEDTTAPEVAVKEQEDTYSVIVGNEIPATDLIDAVDDLAEIKSVSFDTNQIEVETESDNPLDKLGLLFDTAGKYTVSFVAEDENGNKATKDIAVKVIEDYEAHVSGFADLTVEQGKTIDYLAGITSDEKIASVTVDGSTVDSNIPGEYELTYTITGDDMETVLTKNVKVTVTEPTAVATKPSNSNNSGTSKSKVSGTNSTSSGTSASVSENNEYDPYTDETDWDAIGEVLENTEWEVIAEGVTEDTNVHYITYAPKE